MKSSLNSKKSTVKSFFLPYKSLISYYRVKSLPLEGDLISKIANFYFKIPERSYITPSGEAAI